MVAEPLQQVDPGLRRAARMLRPVTSSTPDGFRRQVRFTNALWRRHRPGRTNTRVRNDIEVGQRWTTRTDGSPLRLLIVLPVVPRVGDLAA